MKRTLVLNAGYEPLQLVSWQKAITLLFAAKAEVVAEHDETIHTVSREYALPSVIRLKRYVRASRPLGMATCNRKNVLLRDRYQCQYCGLLCRPSIATIDHIIPRSRGGGATWQNLVTACSSCNRRKGSQLLSEVGMRLRRPPRAPAWRELWTEEPTSCDNGDWTQYFPKVS